MARLPEGPNAAVYNAEMRKLVDQHTSQIAQLIERTDTLLAIITEVTHVVDASEGSALAEYKKVLELIYNDSHKGNSND